MYIILLYLFIILNNCSIVFFYPNEYEYEFIALEITKFYSSFFGFAILDFKSVKHVRAVA